MRYIAHMLGRGVPMIRAILVAILLLLGAVLSASAQVAYDRKARLLSVTYDGAPLREVLAEISRKTGIAVYIDPTVEKSVFIDRVRGPVDEVLNEIVKPLNNMLIYKGDDVTAVRIYDQSPSDAMQKIEPGDQPMSAPPSVAVPSASTGSAASSAEHRELPGADQERQERRRESRQERRKKFEERRAEQERLRREVLEKRLGPGKQPGPQNSNE